MLNSQSSYLAGRYSRTVALRHEQLYGRGYQGPSSEKVFVDLADPLQLKAGAKVLDVGSGLGGDALRITSRFGANVLGLDASPDMTRIARERAEQACAEGVDFVTGDVIDHPLDGLGVFDVVWSRDCLVFVPHGAKLPSLSRLHTVLRPGGQLVVTDYCLGPNGGSPEYASRMALWDHYMLAPAAYRRMLMQAQFIDIEMEDRTDDLRTNLVEGRSRLLTERLYFLQQMSADEYETLLLRWNRKIASCERGEVVWPAFTARRSPTTP